MRVKISFHVRAQSLGSGKESPAGGAGVAAGNLLDVPFYEFEKDLQSGALRLYMRKIQKVMSGFARALDIMNRLSGMG